MKLGQSFEELKLTGRLPSPPGVGMAILKLTEADDFSVADISHAIQTDPALTGRILKFTNSARSVSVSPITTVDEAVVRVGVQSIRTVVLGFSLISAYSEGACEAFDYGRFWSESLARAVGAKRLSQSIGLAVPAEAYSIGLLSGIGRLALASVHSAEYSKVIGRSGGEPRMLLKFENEAFAIDHGQAGACLLRDWGLPESHCRAVDLIERDYDPEAEEAATQDLVAVVRLATRIAEVCVAGEDVASEIWNRIETLRHGTNLSPDELISVCDQIVTEWKDWAQILDVQTNDVPPFSEIRMLATEPEQSDSPLAGARKDRPLRVLAVDDERVSLRLLSHQLKADGYDVTEASGGKEALEMALSTVPDVIVTDWKMPGMDGLELCRTLRRHEIGQSIYIVILTGMEDEDAVVEAFESEIDDYVTKPFNPKVLRARVRAGARVVELKRQVAADQSQLRENLAALAVLNRRLEKTSLTDPLTQLPNRRFAMERLGEAWGRHDRNGAPFSLIMIDIDHFKRVNDDFGHDTGDEVLRNTAAVLDDETRESEVVCRLGGEEFLVICDGGLAGAEACAARLRESIEANVIEHGDFKEAITISLGVAYAESDDDSLDDVLRRSDEAVYQAKRDGRNRIVILSAPQTA